MSKWEIVRKIDGKVVGRVEADALLSDILNGEPRQQFYCDENVAMLLFKADEDFYRLRPQVE